MFGRANNINRGEVRDPYSISVLNTGYIGLGPYDLLLAFNKMIYSRWRGIIERCILENKILHEDFRNFQYFAAWFYSEFYIIPGCSAYDICIDKDILYPGNREYSPYRCLFIPDIINNKIQIKEYDRYQIERLYSGHLSDHEIKRIYAHKEYREKIVRELAEEYRSVLPPHVYLALIKYKMF